MSLSVSVKHNNINDQLMFLLWRHLYCMFPYWTSFSVKHRRHLWPYLVKWVTLILSVIYKHFGGHKEETGQKRLSNLILWKPRIWKMEAPFKNKPQWKSGIISSQIILKGRVTFVSFLPVQQFISQHVWWCWVVTTLVCRKVGMTTMCYRLCLISVFAGHR